jgi:hypothetical protein
MQDWDGTGKAGKGQKTAFFQPSNRFYLGTTGVSALQ